MTIHGLARIAPILRPQTGLAGRDQRTIQIACNQTIMENSIADWNTDRWILLRRRERIIRNEKEMENIWKDIEANPSTWADDDENPLKAR
ncbi:MAG: hypothetical protein M1282_09250 [Chloroflexi bacterium]|nr:hypothetical protein [Chloroflexota bacterium]